jgi:hypothetical protein
MGGETKERRKYEGGGGKKNQRDRSNKPDKPPNKAPHH